MKNKVMTKNQCENEIKRAIEHAQENGFSVYVAGDEEGNNFSYINPTNMLYDSNDKSIVLAVWEHVDEEKIFKQ